MLNVRVARIGSVQVPLPAYQTAGAAGMDLCAALEQPCVLAPGERKLIRSGLCFEIPSGYEAQVRPRSGLALRFGVTVLNAPGTIDSDFRGEVGVVLINHGLDQAVINPGDRIAQLVFARTERVTLTECPSLDPTERGAGGYGSTGVSA
jgi:dUTP pyrophosphatase